MVNTLEAVSNDAMGLQPAERVVLAHRLLASVEPVEQSEVDAAWDAEIAARMSRLERGETSEIPASEAFARLRKITGKE